MRFARTFVLAFLSLTLTVFFAQPVRPGGQAASSGVSASHLLQQSLAALQGSTPITDVTLSGTAHRIVGSDDESGTVTLQAVGGSSSISRRALNPKHAPFLTLLPPGDGRAPMAWRTPRCSTIC